MKRMCLVVNYVHVKIHAIIYNVNQIMFVEWFPLNALNQN